MDKPQLIARSHIILAIKANLVDKSDKNLYFNVFNYKKSSAKALLKSSANHLKLDIKVCHSECITFNKGTTRFDLIAHQGGE